MSLSELLGLGRKGTQLCTAHTGKVSDMSPVWIWVLHKAASVTLIWIARFLTGTLCNSQHTGSVLTGKIFFKDCFLFKRIGRKYWPVCQDVFKSKSSFCYVLYNFTSVCKNGKMYLFCKNEEGLLIEKDDTSVLQFTVHMPPVRHLFCHYKLVVIHVE